jgi:hypothetical protein
MAKGGSTKGAIAKQVTTVMQAAAHPTVEHWDEADYATRMISKIVHERLQDERSAQEEAADFCAEAQLNASRQIKSMREIEGRINGTADEIHNAGLKNRSQSAALLAKLENELAAAQADRQQVKVLLAVLQNSTAALVCVTIVITIVVNLLINIPSPAPRRATLEGITNVV